MDYADLVTNVQSALGRSDVPSFVYTLAHDDIVAEFKQLEMEATDSLDVSSEFTDLPSDFGLMLECYIDADPRTDLRPIPSSNQNYRRDDSGVPYYYSIVYDDDTALAQIRVMPTPDGEYTVAIRYSIELTEPTDDDDENVVMARYPALYLYGSLLHAAIWAQDQELINTYQAAYTVELEKFTTREGKRKIPQTLTMRPAFDLRRP